MTLTSHYNFLKKYLQLSYLILDQKHLFALCPFHYFLPPLTTMNISSQPTIQGKHNTALPSSISPWLSRHHEPPHAAFIYGSMTINNQAPSKQAKHRSHPHHPSCTFCPSVRRRAPSRGRQSLHAEGARCQPATDPSLAPSRNSGPPPHNATPPSDHHTTHPSPPVVVSLSRHSAGRRAAPPHNNSIRLSLCEGRKWSSFGFGSAIGPFPRYKSHFLKNKSNNFLAVF